VKVKFNRRQEFVGGGYKPIAGGFESLLVGQVAGVISVSALVFADVFY
jgi:hypothetical protein